MSFHISQQHCNKLDSTKLCRIFLLKKGNELSKRFEVVFKHVEEHILSNFDIIVGKPAEIKTHLKSQKNDGSFL